MEIYFGAIERAKIKIFINHQGRMLIFDRIFAGEYNACIKSLVFILIQYLTNIAGG